MEKLVNAATYDCLLAEPATCTFTGIEYKS